MIQRFVFDDDESLRKLVLLSGYTVLELILFFYIFPLIYVLVQICIHLNLTIKYRDV